MSESTQKSTTQELTNKEKAAKNIQHNALFAAAVCIAPAPLIDIPAVGAIQYSMLIDLCKIYDVEFSGNRSRAIITALITSSAPMLALGLASAVKIIPGIGSMIGTVGAVTSGGAFTYALGQMMAKHLEHGGTLATFDIKAAQNALSDEMEKGKEFIKNEQAKRVEGELEPKQPA